jgi:predicted nucleic acid-binding protein
VSIFVDTGIFVGFVNKRDKDHERAKILVKELAQQKYGIAYTSDYVLDEAVTVTLVRTRRLEAAINAGFLILGSIERKIPSITRMLRVDEKILQESWQNFISGKTPRLSFTDHTCVNLARTYSGGMIMSFDAHFDSLLTRVS